MRTFSIRSLLHTWIILITIRIENRRGHFLKQEMIRLSNRLNEGVEGKRVKDNAYIFHFGAGGFS